MVDIGKSDKMRKISGIVDKSDTDNGFSNNISLLNPLSVFDLSSIPYIYIYINIKKH